MAVKIFFCYAREDEPLLNELKAHLRPLQYEGLIEVWHDRDINAGTEWEEAIKEQLNSTQIILLLISPAFMNSDYCYGVEMKKALERHNRREAQVIPVILRHVHWQGVLGNLQVLPTDARPIRSWPDLDEAFFNVAKGIRKLAEEQIRKDEETRKAEEVGKDKIARVITALENPDYNWRTIEGVSSETKLTHQEVQKIISDLGKQVIKSDVDDSKGRPLYATRAHYKRRK